MRSTWAAPQPPLFASGLGAFFLSPEEHMVYVRRNWQNSPSSATPLDAAALNNIEDGIEEALAGGGGGGVATPDATASVKGKVRLTGDLGGTADAPTVPGLAAKSNTGHTHAQSDVTGLVTALSGKAATSHTHAEGDVTGLTAALAGKAPTSHTHTAANVTDFNTAADARVAAGITGKLDTSAAPELIRDTIGAALVAGTNVTITPDDTGDTITIAASGGGGGGLDAEQVRDTIAAALTAGNGVTVTPNDGTDTITVAVAGAVVRAVIVATGSEARPAGVDTVVWINPDTMTVTNALDTDLVVTPGDIVDVRALVDAKGDLLVGSSADTLTRLPAGTNGQVLTADSAEASGTKWATPSGGGAGVNVFPKAAGSWIGQSSVAAYGQTDNGQLPSGRLQCELLHLTEPTIVDRMGVAVQTAGAGGSVIRLGVYSISSTGDIGTLLIDAGTTAADSTGDKALTLGSPVTLQPGAYWMVGVSNDASGSLRTKATGGGTHFAMNQLVSPFGNANINSEAWVYVYYTGYDPTVALPATGSLTGRNRQGQMDMALPQIPLFWVRKQP